MCGGVIGYCMTTRMTGSLPPELQMILEEDRDVFEALARGSNTITKKRNKPR